MKHHTKNSVFCLFVCLAAALYSGCAGVQPRVVGRVYSSDNLLQSGHQWLGEKPVNPAEARLYPLENTTVRFGDIDDFRTTQRITNRSGFFDLALPVKFLSSPAAEYRLIVNKPGFEAYEVTLTTTEMQTYIERSKGENSDEIIKIWLYHESPN
jgi:hypothetical protein